MKTPFSNKTLIVLAVAIATTGSISRAQDQSVPPPVSDAALPPEIAPNSPLAQVVKLVQAGTDLDLIKNFVANSQGAFNLDADTIMTLNDLGVPKDVINAMLDRDKALYAAANMPPPSTAPAPTTDTAVDTAPPPTEVTVNYFDDTLSPYGSWVVVEGYGRCWRPTVVNYDSGWRPYCDRGHWVYTDCGWYWDSDYSWGVTFHYGRWFRHARFGWCWAPDTAWGPSWVTWRSSGDYCGWAPLPPLAVYRPGAGLFYRGVSVTANFDFGLGADYFTFVTPDRFCDHHPRRFCVEPARVPVVFNHTTIINDFNHTTINHGGRHDTVFVNNGISVAQVNAHAHTPIEAVHVGSLPNATRQGWRGDVTVRQVNHAVSGNNNNNNNPARNSFNGNNNQANHNPVIHDNGNNDVYHKQGNDVVQTQKGSHQTSSPIYTPRQQTFEPPVNRNAQYNRTPPNNSVNVNNNNNNNSHVQIQQQVQPQPHVNAPVVPERFAPPQIEQRQVDQRPVEQQKVQQRQIEQQQVQPVEKRSNVEQHNSPPATAPSPSQGQSHNDDRGSDKDQKNH